MDLLSIVARQLPDQLQPPSIEVGLSGGLDSVVLLHVLNRLRQQHHFHLTAVHVHHGLSPHADEWADFCGRYCRALNVDLRVCRIQVEKQKLGVEAAARVGRYRIFSDGRCEVLALAHHQDDQLETFMLAVARGGGIRALAAMPSWRDLNERIRLWRPLLGVSRATLEAYTVEYGLAYVHDESNQDTAYLRNWVRHESLPQWRKRVPHLNQHVLANIRSLQEDLAILEDVMAADYRQTVSDGRLSVPLWRQLSEGRRKRLLHHFLQQRGMTGLNHHLLEDMNRIMMSAEHAHWQWEAGEAAVYRGHLFVWQRHILQIASQENGHAVQGRLKEILQEHGFVLKRHAYGLPESVLQQSGYIRSVDKQDQIFLGYGHKSLHKLLQEKRIVPSVRPYWPVIADEDNHCLVLANLSVSRSVAVEGGWLPVHPQWTYFMPTAR